MAQRGINLLFILLFCPFCGSKRLKKDEKGLIQTKGQDAVIICMCVCVVCVLKSRVIFLSLFLSLSLAILKIFFLPLLLYFFFHLFLSLSLALQCHLSSSYFFYLLLLGSFSRFHFAQLLRHHEGQLDRLARVQARVAVG